MDNVSPHALIQSFFQGMSDFLTTLIRPSSTQRETFTITFCVGAGTSANWRADVACALRRVFMAQKGGTSNTIARANVSGSLVSGATPTVTDKKVIAFFTALSNNDCGFLDVCEKFAPGDLVWAVNGSAGTSIFVCVFEKV